MSDIPTSEQIENEDARRHYPPHLHLSRKLSTQHLLSTLSEQVS